MHATAHCTRCQREVSVVGVWSGFVWVKRLWYLGLLVVTALMPILLAEITVLLPMAMVFALAAGPVHSLAREVATCSDCGAEIPSKRNAGAQKTP